MAIEPEELAIRDNDDGKILEDGVDGDRKVLLWGGAAEG